MSCCRMHQAVNPRARPARPIRCSPRHRAPVGTRSAPPRQHAGASTHLQQEASRMKCSPCCLFQGCCPVATAHRSLPRPRQRHSVTHAPAFRPKPAPSKKPTNCHQVAHHRRPDTLAQLNTPANPAPPKPCYMYNAVMLSRSAAPRRWAPPARAPQTGPCCARRAPSAGSCPTARSSGTPPARPRPGPRGT